jgi:hypothetical protein
MTKRFYSLALTVSALALLAFSNNANATSISFAESSVLPSPVSNPGPSIPAFGTFSDTQTLSITNVQLSPYQGTSDYTDQYSVLDGMLGGGIPDSTATYNQGNGLNTSVFKFLWGSPDAYNTVNFYSGLNGTGGLIASITGSDLSDATPGSGYDFVTFTATGGTIGSVVLEDAGSAAFEYADQTLGGNLAGTPIPAALPLFAAGLGFLALFSRRRKQNKSPAAAA